MIIEEGRNASRAFPSAIGIFRPGGKKRIDPNRNERYPRARGRQRERQRGGELTRMNQKQKQTLRRERAHKNAAAENCNIGVRV